MTKKYQYFVFFLCGLSISFECLCQKPKSGEGESMGTVEVIITPMVGKEPLIFGKEYTTPGGEKFSLRTLKFFLCDIGLSKSTGIESPAISEKYKEGVYLINYNESNYNAGFGNQSYKITFNAKPGDYSDIRFNIGIPRKLNHSDPTSAPAPLDLGKGDMFWAWNSGYIFFLAEGKQLDVENEIFHFAVGGDFNMMPFSFGNLFDIKPLLKVNPNKTTRINFTLDFNKIFINGNGSIYSLKSDDASIVHGGYYASLLRNNMLQALKFTSSTIVD